MKKLVLLNIQSLNLKFKEQRMRLWTLYWIFCGKSKTCKFR